MGQAPGLEPERLLRPPTIFDPAMSPDGKHIAYSAEHKGERVVIILDEEMNPFKLTAGARMELGDVVWASNKTLFVAVQTIERSRRTNGISKRWMRYDLDKPKRGLRDFTSDAFKYGGWFYPIPDKGKTLFVTFPRYWRKWFHSRPYVLESDTRKIRLFESLNPDDIHYWVPTINADFAMGLKRFVGDTEAFFPSDGEWQFMNIIPEITPLYGNGDGTVLAVDNRGEGYNSLVNYNILTQEISPVFEAEELDVGNRSDFHENITYNVTYSPHDRRVVAALAPMSYNGGQVVFDKKWNKISEFVKKSLGEEFVKIESISEEGSRSIFSTQGPTDPRSYYLLDLKKKSLEFLFSRRDWLDESALTAPRKLEIPSPSLGYGIHAKLYQHSNTSPTIVLVGTYRNGEGYHLAFNYSSRIQFLVSRGYNVLDLALPGATGYGKHYYEAGRNALLTTHVDALRDIGAYLKTNLIPEGGSVILNSLNLASTTAAHLLASDGHHYDAWISGNGFFDWPKSITIGRRRVIWGSNYGHTIKQWIGDPFDEESDFHKIHVTDVMRHVNVPVALYGQREADHLLDAATDELKLSNTPYEVKIFERDENDFDSVEETIEYYEEVVRLLDWLVKES